MNVSSCVDAVDLLPDWVAGRLDPFRAGGISAHVGSCSDCAREADLLRALASARPEPPAAFADRVLQGLAPATDGPQIPLPRSPRWRPGWAIPAAAVLVLAVGTAVLELGPRGASTALPAEAAPLGEVASDDADVWILDDGAVAGAPVLDDLSDDALVALAEELGA